MITFAHMADTHLGAGRSTGRVDEIIDSFKHAFDAANQDDQVEFILVAGDVFDRVSPPWHVVSKFIRIVRTARKPVYVIAGNHDTSRVRIGGSLWEILEAIPTEYVNYIHGFESKVFDLPGGATLVATPWGALQEKKDQEFRRSRPVGVTPTIWMTHGASDGVVGSYANFLSVNVTEEEMADYTYVALGDLHSENQVQPNAWYSGSTDRMNWSDYEANPHWLKVTIHENDELDVVEMPIPVRDMFRLPPINAKNMSAFHLTGLLDEYIEDPETMYSVDILELDYRERKEVRDYYKKNGFSFVRLSFVNKPTSEEYDFDQEDIDTKQPTVEELFSDFLAHRQEKYPEGFAEKFKSYGMNALNQARMEGEDINNE